MRILMTAVMGALALGGSAFATNLALTATASTNENISGFPASNANDNNLSTSWVAPGGSTDTNPFLLLTLASPATNVGTISVSGLGLSGLFSAFDVFVSATAPNTANSTTETQSAFISQINMTLVGSNTDQADGTAWTDTFNVPAGTVAYVMYLGIAGSGGGCPGTCVPGNATFSGSTPVSGQDDAAVAELGVNTTPEPATFGLLCLPLLALGFARRFRKPV